MNDHVSSLNDVKWEMRVENGREVWIVELIIEGREDNPVVMKLNYEELSLVSFKVNQVAGHLKAIDLDKVV